MPLSFSYWQGKGEEQKKKSRMRLGLGFRVRVRSSLMYVAWLEGAQLIFFNFQHICL